MIEGQKELERKFGALGQVADQHMERIVKNQIKRVQAEAKLLCPVRDGELRTSIKTMTERRDDMVIGTMYTNKAYAMYVEMGTGPKGAANHSGISPVANPAYTMSPWWIHESQVDKEAAEEYHWFYLDTPEGRFYQCTGQPARPFMYPALKNNENRVVRNMENALKRELRKVSR